MAKNILSVGAMTDRGLSVTFGKDKCIIQKGAISLVIAKEEAGSHSQSGGPWRQL